LAGGPRQAATIHLGGAIHDFIDNHSPRSLNLVWDLQLLERAFRHPIVNTVQYITPAIRRNVATCMSLIMASIVQRPDHLDSYVQFFLFPRAVLRNMPHHAMVKLRRADRRDAQSKYLAKRLSEWLKGGDHRDSLIQEVLDSPFDVQQSFDSEEANLRRCEKLARTDGQFRKAVRSLHSHGIAPACPATTQRLVELHPHDDGITHQPLPASSLEVQDDHVLKLLRSFPKGVGCGRSGWRAHHLVELSSCDGTNFLESLTKLVNLFLSGRAMPAFATFMSSASLVPLLKKDLLSIRPIAVGEIFRRLVSKCCVHAVTTQAASYLSPLQLGVGVQHGAESILHAFNRSISADFDPDTIIALLDFKNAFNLVDRSKFLTEVLSRYPSIFAWVQYSYGSAATLFAGNDVLYARRGVQQGDPLSPLLFALAIHPLLMQLSSKCHLAAAYLDDITLKGSSSQVRDAVSFVEAEGPAYGVFLSSEKTVIWWPAHPTISPESFDSFMGFQRTLGLGVELLGGALSTSYEFVLTVVTKRVDKCIAKR
jgi:hypothetical protein